MALQRRIFKCQIIRASDNAVYFERMMESFGGSAWALNQFVDEVIHVLELGDSDLIVKITGLKEVGAKENG